MGYNLNWKVCEVNKHHCLTLSNSRSYSNMFEFIYLLAFEHSQVLCCPPDCKHVEQRRETKTRWMNQNIRIKK